MSIKFTKLSSILLISAISGLFALEAKAEEPMSLNDTFREAYFTNTGDNFDNSSLLGQLNNMIGFKKFPDRQISADAKLIDSLYENALEAQSQVGSPMRTRDIASPYGTSLMENPSYLGN